jgi:hypothetical protein
MNSCNVLQYKLHTRFVLPALTIEAAAFNSSIYYLPSLYFNSTGVGLVT